MCRRAGRRCRNNALGSGRSEDPGVGIANLSRYTHYKHPMMIFIAPSILLLFIQQNIIIVIIIITTTYYYYLFLMNFTKIMTDLDFNFLYRQY